MFSYNQAFSRNLGWVTPQEQAVLRTKRIAIAGLGGVGGSHLLTLTRLGIGSFHIADFDTFDLVNFNRQAGATLSSLGRPKVEVLAAMAKDINPEINIKPFPSGIDEHNLSEFFTEVDLYVDGLDFFALPARRAAFTACAKLGIPAITAAPLGMGVAYLIFMPGGMTFEDYFCLQGLETEHQYVNFLVGLSPKGFHRPYLVDLTRVSLAGRDAPSTVMACQLCAGVAGVEALKILLGRGKVWAAPHYHHFDAYQGKWVRGWLPGGNRNPMQILKRHIGYRMYARLSRNSPPRASTPLPSEIEEILELARWAPSGDNAQPWRFDIVTDDKLTIHVTIPDTNVYEYNNGQPSLLSLGFLLESIRIAATRFGRSLTWSHQHTGKHEHTIDVELPVQPEVTEDPLLSFLAIRSVNRRRYKMIPLTPEQKQALTAALGNELEIRWHETLGERWRMARINMLATNVRLRIREAFEVHRRILDWEREFSMEGVPVKAIGLDPLTLRTMKWVMQDWPRMHFMNRFLGGTVTPRVELDLLPGLFCSAHFSITRKNTPAAGDETPSLVRAGQALQRFWLTATRIGLVMQPSLAPLCFAHYGKHKIAFTTDNAIHSKAEHLATRLSQACGIQDSDNLLFMGRIGPISARVESRSIRRPLSSLLNTPKANPK